MENQTEDVKPIETTALFGWLGDKLAETEKSLSSREAMANPPRISEEEWEALKARPGTIMTKGRKLSKAELKEIEMAPLRHKRIAVKIRRDVEMFKAAIAQLARLPQTADGKPIFLGDTIFALNEDASYWGPDAILTQTVQQMAMGSTFDDYAGTFTIVGDDWEGGNLDCYARRENVPIDLPNVKARSRARMRWF